MTSFYIKSTPGAEFKPEVDRNRIRRWTTHPAEHYIDISEYWLRVGLASQILYSTRSFDVKAPALGTKNSFSGDQLRSVSSRFWFTNHSCGT